MRKNLNLRANIALGLIFAFLANTFGPVPLAQADEFRLPAPGVRVNLSPEFNPPILKGIKVHPDNPFRFDFILDQGDAYQNSSVIARSEATKQSQQEQLKTESTKGGRNEQPRSPDFPDDPQRPLRHDETGRTLPGM